MRIVEEYKNTIEELYQISNPIIKYRIDTELYKKDVSMKKYISKDDKLITYWLNIYDYVEIHGSRDRTYENSIAKLLEFGLTKNNVEFDKKFRVHLQEKYWTEIQSFNEELTKTVLYPFLIRAGYDDNENIKDFLQQRINIIEKTIDKYGYDIQERNSKFPKKYQDEFVFKIDITTEWLPTIYDLYAFAFYKTEDNQTAERIERIVQYLLHEDFQKIPQKAYIYDRNRKRYYAAGNVYHACMREERRLLMIYLLSHFKASGDSEFFKAEVKQLLTYKKENGFFEFEKSYVKEKKGTNYIYAGSHMGLGERRTSSNWRMIESTFWMLKILSNLECNNCLHN